MTWSHVNIYTTCILYRCDVYIHTHFYIKMNKDLSKESNVWSIIKSKSQDIIHHHLFDQIIMFCILFNSLLMAIADYGSVDDGGDLQKKGSIRNTILEESELYFLSFGDIVFF